MIVNSGLQVQKFNRAVNTLQKNGRELHSRSPNWDLINCLTAEGPGAVEVVKQSTMDQGTRGPFVEAPSNLTGPESDFDIKVSRKVGRVLTSDEVHFVSLGDNFTVHFSNLLKHNNNNNNFINVSSKIAVSH